MQQKNLILSLLVFLLFFGTNISSAQNKIALPSKNGKNEHAPLKKDGTKDMRYKENKSTEKPKHLKKDGSPDMRYKENKK